MDLVHRTFKVCDEALQQADITTRDLDGVILVGGPTRLPVIWNAVCGYFQREPKADVDPDEVVAMGAAIHAASLVGDSQDSFLLDVTPLDLRIGLAGGLAEPVIEANTPVPIEQTRRFTTFKDFQQSVQIRVYQGGSIQADENELLGQFNFSDFEKGKRGEVAIDVTFEINADGIVEVTALDPATGRKSQTTIELSSGLSDSELEDILNEDRTARVARVESDSEPASPAASAAPAGPTGTASEALDDALDLELDDGGDELELLDDDELLMLSAEDEPELEIDLENAITAPDLSGDPNEPLILDEIPSAGPMSKFEPNSDLTDDEKAKQELFGTDNVDLSAGLSDDEL
jgi:molecular chaperone DnaK (HSP70)